MFLGIRIVFLCVISYGVFACSTHRVLNESSDRSDISVVLSNVHRNNKKLNVFTYKFSISVFSEGNVMYFNGIAYIDNSVNAFRVRLFDSLFNSDVIDCALEDERFVLYVHATRTIFQGMISSLKANFFGFNIQSLVKLASLRSPLCNYEGASIRDYQKTQFLIENRGCRQVVQFYESTQRVQKLFVLTKKKFSRIVYKRYADINDVYYPQLIHVYGASNKSKVIFSVTHFLFNSSLPKTLVQLPKYSYEKIVILP